MAIFAKPSNSIIDYSVINKPLENNQVLAFDECTGFFTNKKLELELTNAVASASNLGGVNAIGVFNGISSDRTLEFRSFIPGTGINIHIDENNNIVFDVDESDHSVFVSEDYFVVIDNDGNNPDSRFEIKTASSDAIVNIPIQTVMPLSASNIYTEISASRGLIKSYETNFETHGFDEGMIVSVSGTPDQDGTYTISEITTFVSGAEFFSEMKFEETFSGSAAFNLGGPKQTTVIKQFSAWVPDMPINEPEYESDRRYIVQIWDINLGISGHNLQSGSIIDITGSNDCLIDGRYIVSEILNTPGDINSIGKWTGIKFKPETPLPKNVLTGPIYDANLCSNELNISIGQYIKPTGFWVNARGELHANRIFLSAEPVEAYDVVNKNYVDLSISESTTDIVNVEISGINVSLSELETKIQNLKKLHSKPLRYYLNHAKW